MGFYRTVITKAGCSFLFCSNYFMTNYSIVFFCILNSLVSYTTIIPTNPNCYLAFGSFNPKQTLIIEDEFINLFALLKSV